jgi:hypothetical protein
MLHLLIAADVKGSIPVELFRTAFGFSVRYGLQVESGLTLDEALDKYADALRHSLECGGLYSEDAA